MSILIKLSLWSIALIHLLQPFAAIPLDTPKYIAALLVLICAIPKQSPGFRKITLIFLCVGSAGLVGGGAPLTIWLQSAASMTSIIAILMVMQLFTVPIETGDYHQTIEYWLTRTFTKEASLFFFTMLATHVFASFLLFGTVPVMVSLFAKTLKKNVSHYERFISAAVARGYALVVFWAPGAVNLFLVMQATGTQWTELCVPGLLLAGIGMITSYFFERWAHFGDRPIVASLVQGQTITSAEARRKTIHIILVVLGLILSTVLFERLHMGTNATRILLAAVMVASAWLLLYRNDAKLPLVLKMYWQIGIMKAVDLSVLFIAMGLFAGAVDSSGILLYLQPVLQQFVTKLGLFSLLFIPVLMIVLAVIGIHPFILILMFGKIFTALQLPVAQVSLALCLALGGSVSFIVSPFGGITLMLAKFVGAKTIDITVQWNLAFSAVFLIEGVIFAYIWGLFTQW